MLAQLREFSRYHAGLREFLRTPLTEAACLERIRRGLAERERSFLDVVERGVFAQPASPYRTLFEHAGLERGDVSRLVRDEGVDGALDRLYEAGVRVTLQEFRGTRPIERPGLSFAVDDTDFDNPLAVPVRQVTIGGSRSAGRRVLLNFEHQEHGVASHALFAAAHGVSGRPEAIWRPLSSRTGLNNALRSVKLGQPLEKWFSQTRIGQPPFPLRGAALTWFVLLACRLWAEPIPMPEHVPFLASRAIWRATATR